MKVEVIDGKMIHITADEGKKLILKDRSAVYDDQLYGPLNLDTKLYDELDEKEAEALKKSIAESFGYMHDEGH